MCSQDKEYRGVNIEVQTCLEQLQTISDTQEADECATCTTVQWGRIGGSKAANSRFGAAQARGGPRGASIVPCHYPDES